MAVAHPDGKAVRPGKIIRIDLRDRRNSWETRYRKLNPGRENRGQNHDCDSDQNGRANPNAEAAILRVVYCPMGGVEGNHY